MNESEFWDAAYRENAPALSGVLRRYVSDTAVAQDLLHEVFIAAICKHAAYSGKGSFEGWLHRIAVNTALMYLRGEKNRRMSSEALLRVADDDASEVERVDDARTAIEEAEFSDEELLSAIDRLPDHHKVVFNMYVMDDFSHRQIAAELNISPGTSKSHLARARKKIQQYLYDDALNRKRKKYAKRASVFLLLPGKTHFIDRLYRARLSDLTLPPPSDISFLSTALEQSAGSAVSQAAATTAAQAVSQVAFWGSKLSYAVVCCGTAAITGTVCRLTMSESGTSNRGKESVAPTDVRTHSPNPGDENSVFDAANHEAFVQTDSVSEPIDTTVSEESFRRDEQAESMFAPAASTHSASTSPAASKSESEPTSGFPAEKVSGNGTQTATGKKPGEPVVVKKQIIQHQTVVVRDTIVIHE